LQRYIIRRLLWAIPTFFGAITLIFLLMNVMPGDLAMMILGEETGTVDPKEYAALKEQLGLNIPLWEQYFSWLWDVVRLDLGTSLWTGQPVSQEIAMRMPYTASLVVFAVVITILTSIPIGVLSALHQDSWIDYTLRSAVIAGISLPNFWFGILIILFMLSVFRWFPPMDYATLWNNPGVAIQQLFLPAFALGFRGAASATRMMRSAMLEVLREDYVRTARAKGLKERTVIYLHAMRNAILPVVTIYGMEFAFLFAGTVIIETIFNIPGVGLLLINAINQRDVILVQGVVVTLVTIVLVVNILVDLLYAWIDPRVRFR